MPSSFALLGAGGAVSPLVQDLGLCLVAAAVCAVVFERLRIPTIAALIVAGVLIGPVGMSLISSASNIETIANLGLTLLLFVIGLEVNLGSLLASGRTLILTGLLQVPITVAVAAVAFGVMGMLGWDRVGGWYASLYLGAACAFSSTLLVVKILQERLKLDSVSGRLCVGLLIFQDVWAIVFLALQPNLEDPNLGPIGLTFAGIFLLVAIAGAAARWVFPAAFRIVAKVPELVVTLSLGWCFGLGLLGAHLGTALSLLGVHMEVSVSMEMGALIAGASLAASPYTYEVVAKVTNLRDFFVTFFFVGLGMTIPMPRGMDVVVLSLALSVTAVALRYAVFLPLLYATGLDRRHALETATKLAQVSEFCLVIAYLGLKFGHIDHELVSAIIFAFIITALLTPTMFAASDTLYDRVAPLLGLMGLKKDDLVPGEGRGEGGHGSAPRVVILGFHRIAAALTYDLAQLQCGILSDTLVVDFNVALHDRIRALGASVVYGDISNPETLRHIGIEQAELVISTVPDELLKKTNNAQIARAVRKLNPNAIIISHATRLADVEPLFAAGANDVFLAPIETASAILPAVLAALNGNLSAYLKARELEHGSLRGRQHVLD